MELCHVSYRELYNPLWQGSVAVPFVRGLASTDSLMLHEVEIAIARRLMVHVQSKDGPVIKLYLWDQAAKDFCKKFKAHENPPTVVLVATVNPKRLEGKLLLASSWATQIIFGNTIESIKGF